MFDIAEGAESEMSEVSEDGGVVVTIELRVKMPTVKHLLMVKL
jgi:hypothetical protein